MVDIPTKRDGWRHDVRRVPADLASLDARVIVRQSKGRIPDDSKGAAGFEVARRRDGILLPPMGRGIVLGSRPSLDVDTSAAPRTACEFGWVGAAEVHVRVDPTKEVVAVSVIPSSMSFVMPEPMMRAVVCGATAGANPPPNRRNAMSSPSAKSGQVTAD